MPNDKFIPEFLYFYLSSYGFQSQIEKYKNSSIMSILNKTNFQKIKIPVPSLEVQNKIVEVLDSFSSLVRSLVREKTAREKQYKYYLNHLITNSKNSRILKLGEVCIRQKGMPITASKMKEINKPDAPICIFAGGKTIAFADYCDIDEKYIITEPSIIVKSRGIIDFEFYDKPFTHKNELWSYRKKSDFINLKFIYYYLQTKIDYFIKKSERGAMPQIATPDTDKFEISLPPLDEQERIVRILDSLNELANGFSVGIPKEIELRQKQYEYYRDKLLEF